MWRMWCSVLALVSLVGCAGPGGGLAPLKEAQVDRYRLDSGDQLRITVYGLNELSQNYTINDSGGISMPLLGAIPVRGKSTDELEDYIEAELAKGLLKDPSVSVQVERFRPFYILGEVKQPGQYPYVPGMTVLAAVAIAGGFTFRAEDDYVAITRREGDSVTEGRAGPQSIVLPGDTILVYERWF